MKERVVEPIEGLIVGRKGDGRSIYSAAGKRALIHACLQPGISVAGSALVNGVNANLLRKWIRQFQSKGLATGHQQRTHRSSAPTMTNRHPLVPLLPIQLTDPEPRAETIPERTAAKPAPLALVPSSGGAQDHSIEIEIAGAKLILRGSVDARQLRLVLSCLAHLSPFRETK